MLIYDSNGAKVKAIVGPHQVNDKLNLTCEVRGGETLFTIDTYNHDIDNAFHVIILFYRFN